jgi:hypothetical protein
MYDSRGGPRANPMRTWAGRRIEELQRLRRSVPGAIALCLIMVLSSAFIVAEPAITSAQSHAGPGQLGAATSPPPLPSNGNVTPGVCLSVTVWFNESGKPSGDSWAVTLHGSKKSSTSASIEFADEECNVALPYTITPPTGWNSLPASGNISSSNGKAGVFVLIFSCSDLTISFGESGLPAGDSWTVELTPTKETSSNSTIDFTGEQCNVDYSYLVTPPAGLYASPSQGYVEGTAKSGPPAVDVTISSCNPTTRAVAIISPVVTSNETNVTLGWEESPAGNLTWLYWGNTSSKIWFQSVAGSGTYSVFLNFLQPSTTYYFEIIAYPPACTSQYTYITGTYNGTWTTQSDPITTNTVISGTVTGGTGQNQSIAGLAVTAWGCINYEGDEYYFASTTTTNSAGHYSISVTTGDTYDQDCDQAMMVELLNWPAPYDGGSKTSNVWTGYWNESIAIYAPEVVNFILPSNLVTGPLVQIADFSNAITSNGFPNSTIAYTNQTTYTTENGFCWQALWVFSGCGSAPSTIGAGNQYSAIGGNLVVTERFRESGTVLFDALSRAWSVTNLSYYHSYSPPVNEPATWPITDTMVPGNSSTYLLYNWGGAGSDNKGIMAYEGRPVTGLAKTSTTQSSSQVQGFQLEVGVELYGVEVSTTVLSLQWSQKASTTYTTSISWTATGNSESVPVCYVAYGIGGSSTSSGTSTDAIGLWAYDPTGSSGNYSCPVPT